MKSEILTEFWFFRIWSSKQKVNYYLTIEQYDKRASPSKHNMFWPPSLIDIRVSDENIIQ